MDNLSNLLTGLALSQLIFLGAFTYANFRHQRLSRVLGLFALCLASFLLGQLPGVSFNAFTDFMLSRLAILTPAALWLFSVSFFRDETKIPATGIGLIALYFVLNTTDALIEILGYDSGQIGSLLGYLVPQLAMFVLSIHVVYMGIEGRRDDLLEERRRLRIPFVISMGAVVIFTLSFGLLSPFLQQLPASAGGAFFLDVIPLLILGAIFIWTLGLNLAVLRLNNDADLLLQNAPKLNLGKVIHEQEIKTSDKEKASMNQISEAMDEQKLYKETGFTISKLGYQLSISEQRLRSIINQTMGFRNFNQFLNHYRVQEATQLITESDESISKIAMDVGYNSLSAFNKAFKDTHGMPPREFRTK